MNQVNADGEFGCICDNVQPTNLNVMIVGEHVLDIERGNRSLKDGTRCEVHRYPYRWHPRDMVKGCVIRVTKNHNELPALDGISDVYGPGTLVTRSQRLIYDRIKVLDFGDYVQAHELVDPTNTSQAGTVGAISL